MQFHEILISDLQFSSDKKKQVGEEHGTIIVRSQTYEVTFYSFESSMEMKTL